MDTLLIFVKEPIPGRVKTRLARTVGDEEAARIYRFLLEKTHQAAIKTSADRRWLFYADERIDKEDDQFPGSFEKYVQCPGDLGQRMADAFQRAFSAGSERVVIIGSDCPELTSEVLDEAFLALRKCDAVIGPTFDGGYYMLGTNRFIPELFQGIAWSTPEVLDQTLAIFNKLHLKFGVFSTLYDIDTEEDWRAYLGRC
ncbi:MAG: TIGR04282 family arsenosugar biosynthesis glycosyltransferase [Saprospiraceae bacterium]|nr:TIGR04282 family arsenosugar biosynthesis glycosyltransferase [Saprospiraceae bacterium]MDW8485050.1 TIGR04282 family arsenosugar biosynthesis glycosyltransferase [Saprospiraceae bacterium]